MKNEGMPLAQLTNKAIGVAHFSFLHSHFSFLISHFSFKKDIPHLNKAPAPDNLGRAPWFSPCRGS
jgi:hypothetical protein